MGDFLEGLFGFVVVVAIIIHGYFLVRYDTVDPCAVTLHRVIAYCAGEAKANELTGFEKDQILEEMKKELKSNEDSWMYCYISAVFPMDKLMEDHQGSCYLMSYNANYAALGSSGGTSIP